MIPLDRRNPFAAWGHEEVKYSAVDSDTSVALGQARFASSLIADSMKNEVANNATFVTKTIIDDEMPEAFGTNNEVTVYPNVATNAYGMNKDLQPEREPGETLDYYGIQGADLEKYNDDNDSGVVPFERATEEEKSEYEKADYFDYFCKYIGNSSFEEAISSDEFEEIRWTNVYEKYNSETHLNTFILESDNVKYNNIKFIGGSYDDGKAIEGHKYRRVYNTENEVIDGYYYYEREE